MPFNFAWTSRRDPDGSLSRQALAQLAEAKKTRQTYDDLLQAAIAEYGDVTTIPVSATYNPVFAQAVKDALRDHARTIGNQVEAAYRLWHQAGRRAKTLRPWAEAARKLNDGRVSYY